MEETVNRRRGEARGRGRGRGSSRRNEKRKHKGPLREDNVRGESGAGGEGRREKTAVCVQGARRCAFNLAVWRGGGLMGVQSAPLGGEMTRPA